MKNYLVNNITTKRPGTGISPIYFSKYLGRKAQKKLFKRPTNQMKKKKIVFVTTNRADYNIQKEIINNLNKIKKLIIFTNIGNAFIKKFGYTKSDLKLKLN